MAPKITDQDEIDFLVLYIKHDMDLRKVREELGNMPRQTAEARLKAIKTESEKRRSAAGDASTSEANGAGDAEAGTKKKAGKGKGAAATAATKPAAKKRKRAAKQDSEEEGDGEIVTFVSSRFLNHKVE